MKKRALSLLLVLAMLFAFAPAFRAEDLIQITKVELGYSAPKPGTTPRDPDVAIQIREGGELKPLKPGDDETFEEITAEWREKGKKEPMTGTFVNAADYELVITLVNVREKFDITAAELYINGVKVNAGDFMSTLPKDIVYTMSNLKATSDITPAVSVKAEDKTEKVYDGKETTIRAAVTNALAGISYRYQWYRDNAPLEGATSDTVKVRNVKDSGVYTCKVTASAAYAAEEKTTESLPVTVKITPLAVTLTLEDVEKNSDEKDPELPYTLLPEGFDPLEGEPAREPGEAEGGYEITAGTLAFPPEVADNYKLTVRNGHFTIVGTGVMTFNRLDEVSDLTHIVGKKGAKIGVRATRDALPEGAILALSMIGEKEKTSFTSVSDGKGILKSLTMSVSGAENNALNKNAVVKLRIPLTEEEERFDVATMKALFLPASGEVEQIPVHREKDELTEVSYLTVELKALGSLAILEGELLPEESAAETETGTTADAGKKKGKDATWLWILIILILVGAAVAIVWLVVRAKLSDAPAGRGSRERSTAPVNTEPPRRPAPPVRNPRTAGGTRPASFGSGQRPAGGETRAIPPVAGRPAPARTPEQRQGIDDPTKTGEVVAPPPVNTGRVISFDDLEDD